MISLSEYLDTPPMGEIVREREVETVKRRYKASLVNRLHKNWGTQSASVNYELRHSLRALRARSREECQNNPLFKKYLSLARANIVGPQGLQLQVRARSASGKNLLTKINKTVEQLWWEFCAAEFFSASGKLNFVNAQNLAVNNLVKDGEVLIQILKASNRFGITAKFYSSDWLDENYNGKNETTGNRIIMSVEVTDDGRPVTYWMTPPINNTMFAVKTDRHRTPVPASEMIHAFLVLDDEEQVRGVPWFHAVLLKAKYLDSLQDSVLIAAQLGANTVGVITQTSPEEGDVEFTGADGEECDPIRINSEPGSFTLLEPGMSLGKFDPEQPHQNHAEHVKLVQGEIATGLDVPYFELTGDLSEVNFSSARIGLNASRDVWKSRQQWLGEAICSPIYHAFVKSAFLNGLLNIDRREFDEIQRPMWRGRGWEYIEPTKDITADLLAIAGGLKSRTGVLAERGVDITDFLETVKAERKEIESADLEFSATGKDAGAEPDATDTTVEDDDPKPSDTKKKDKAGRV